MTSLSSSVIDRHYLLCPVCRRTHACLPVHLQRGCMKEATPETIAEVLEKAKHDALQILQSGRVFSFDLLHRITEDAKPLERLIEELEHRHMVVTDVPLLLPKAESKPSSSTEPAAAETVESDPAEASSAETFEM